MGKSIKVTSNGKVNCPRTDKFVVFNDDCMNCDDMFGVRPGMGNRYIQCKRGGKTDTYISKSPHRRLKS